MNQEFAYGILETLMLVKDAAHYMEACRDTGNKQMFCVIKEDLQAGLLSVKSVCDQYFPKGGLIKLGDACICALESLKDIDGYLNTNEQKADEKLEFELIPIIETMILQFYYWGIVFPNPEKEAEFKAYLEEDGINRYVDEAERTGEYKCDLSIMVTAYNKLEYTKLCVESVLREIPQGISYELILINHGSSDGTKAYFESIPGAKVLNVAVNMAVPGVPVRLVEGKYFLNVSNDIVIGSQAIANLYRCISEHDDYGWVVPTTPNVSNLQTIPLKYDYEDTILYEQAVKENNVYNERKHEFRVRLCNPLAMERTKERIAYYRECYITAVCCGDVMSFPDDKFSLWTRRRGKKCILAKDAYCHHFGSITIGKASEDKERFDKIALEGRRVFFRDFGVDPWGPGNCYDVKLMNGLDYTVSGRINILGINCGLGANPLKIQEIYKEVGQPKEEISICNLVQEKRFTQDLFGVSDEVHMFEDIGDIEELMSGQHYDYVIIEDIIINAESKKSFALEVMNRVSCSRLCYLVEEGDEALPEVEEDITVLRRGDWVIMCR